MPRVTANGIELEYEVRGAGEPLLMIMGIGAQMIAWPDGFLDELIDRGFEVIIFDNRDAGLSSEIDARVGALRPTIARAFLGLPVKGPYTLMDMADDCAGLLDALGHRDAHVLGASMGGMVAQTMAICHPSRVRTLTSVMSHAGHRLDAISTPRALKALLGGPPPRTREQAVARHLAFMTVCGSPAYPFDEGEQRAKAARAYDRSFRPWGFARQLTAIAATGSRVGALRFVRTPTLVIHGSADPLVRPVGGRRTASAIPNSRLEMIEGMGHDLPRQLWPRFADMVGKHTGVSDRAAAARAGEELSSAAN
jgi:pimeloyl-ACP methyl ester carboxylesterase